MSKRILKEGVLGVLSIEFKSLFKNYRHRMKGQTSPDKKYSHSTNQV